MPIPLLTADGFLPTGIFDCTLAEVRTRFGSFQGSERRERLFTKLADLATAAQRSGLFDSILLDGSFVTAKAAPNDVDLVAVLRLGHDFERDMPMSEYALVSRALLRRRCGFDIIVAEVDSPLYLTYVEFFSRIRENPAARKGLLRLQL